MYKLKDLLEIKIIRNITPEMVLKLWTEVYNERSKLPRLSNIIKKYRTTDFYGQSGNEFVPKLNPKQLVLFYQDLLNLKNS